MSEDRQGPNLRARITQGVHLGRWPLLVSGLTLMLAVDLTSADGSVSRVMVLTVGAVLVGSGVVLVSWGHHDPTRRDPRMRTRATDRTTRATDADDGAPGG